MASPVRDVELVLRQLGIVTDEDCKLFSGDYTVERGRVTFYAKPNASVDERVRLHLVIARLAKGNPNISIRVSYEARPPRQLI
jgi:hypothetical protein